MKKLYTVLALIMFACFVTTISAFVLNKTIDKAAQTANIALEQATDEINKNIKDIESFEKGRLYHKSYFTNCFPYVCAKFSFASLYVKTAASVEKQTPSQEIKFDLGTTSFFTTKYNPLTGTLFVNSNANNIIINKNGEKYASVSYQSLNFEITGDTLDYYKAITNSNSTIDDILENITGKVILEVKGLKIGVQDQRFKADYLKIESDTFDESLAKLSTKMKFDIVGSTQNNNVVKTDSQVEVVIKNISKKLVEETLKIAEEYEVALTAATEGQSQNELIQANASYALSYMQLVLDTIESMPALDTQIDVNKLNFKVYDISKKETLMNLETNAKIALDEKLNPKGDLNIALSSDDKELLEAMGQVKFKIPRKEMSGIKLFIQKDSKTYVSTIVAENGMLNVNNKEEITINGLIEAYVKFGSGLIGIAKMSLGIK